MAIISGYPGERGLFFPDQYMRIDKIETSKDKMRIEVGIYTTQQGAIDGELPHSIEFVYGDFDMYSNLNLWEQGYAYVKNRWPIHTDA